ncbi:MAG TPA: 30S ribosomal protein S17 [Candidatus Lokiarchaeia archaeon]|nr:30S ribosomal protein S17 [Candidatus Lokiarchaeia archaeon]
MEARNIGIKVTNLPQRSCDDAHCPYHGNISVRGRIYEGVVTSTKRQNTVTVRRDFLFKVSKYKRFERRNSKKSVHCPSCIDVKVGDRVVFMETRKISKTVASVVIENKTTQPKEKKSSKKEELEEIAESNEEPELSEKADEEDE